MIVLTSGDTALVGTKKQFIIIINEKIYGPFTANANTFEFIKIMLENNK